LEPRGRDVSLCARVVARSRLPCLGDTMPEELAGRPQASGAHRLRLLKVADLDAEQRALHTRIAGGPRAVDRGRIPITDEEGRLVGPFAIMLLSPRVGDAVQAVGAAIRYGSLMTARCRELSILTVAAQLGSGFEWNAHLEAGRTEGLTQDQLQALVDGVVPVNLNAVETLMVSVCRALTVRRGLSDEEYRQAIDLLGAPGLAELVWLIGYYGSLALALDVFNPP